MNVTNLPPARSTTATVLKMLLQMLVFWGLYYVAWPVSLWRVETWLIENYLEWSEWQFGGPVSRWSGIALFLAGGGLALWGSLALACWGAGMPLLAFDRPTRLVIAGPYRYVRHPMAVAGVLQGIAAGIFLGSPLAMFSGVLGGVIWYFRKRPREERFLEERFGEEYRRYRNAVPGYVPRLTGWGSDRDRGRNDRNA